MCTYFLSHLFLLFLTSFRLVLSKETDEKEKKNMHDNDDRLDKELKKRNLHSEYHHERHYHRRDIKDKQIRNSEFIFLVT